VNEGDAAKSTKKCLEDNGIKNRITYGTTDDVTKRVITRPIRSKRADTIFLAEEAVPSATSSRSSQEKSKRRDNITPVFHQGRMQTAEIARKAPTPEVHYLEVRELQDILKTTDRIRDANRPSTSVRSDPPEPDQADDRARAELINPEFKKKKFYPQKIFNFFKNKKNGQGAILKHSLDRLMDAAMVVEANRRTI